MYIYQGTYIYIYLGSLRGHIYTSEMVAKDWTRDTTADREALLQCQKRPTTVSKETYYSVKRDLLQCQKRPTTVSKETCEMVAKDWTRDTTADREAPIPLLYLHTSAVGRV